jgi:teichuronic acid biosynthesis glycosyltransferase TuaG
VLKQTYENLELIVIDDCSEDGTKEWMQKQISKGIYYHYIPKEKSKGGNYARNLGVQFSKGKYIAFLV